MRLKATRPFEDKDGLRQQSQGPQDSLNHQWGWTIPQESFSREGGRTNFLTTMVIIVTWLQDGWSWTRITLPPADSFLKGRC